METKLLIVIISSFIFVVVGGIYLYFILNANMLKKDNLEDRAQLKR